MERLNEDLHVLDQINHINGIREFRNRRHLDRQDPFNFYNNVEFKKRYRVSKDTVRYLINLLKHDLEPQTANLQNISVELMVLTSLRFYAKGFFQQENGKYAAWLLLS